MHSHRLSIKTACLGFLLSVVSVWLVRVWLLHQYSMSMPFWDQWDGEIGLLLRPWQEGSYDYANLFSAHNEHRIFFSRVASLVYFLSNDSQFDNLVATIANAALYAATFMGIAFATTSSMHVHQRMAMLLVAFLMAVAPVGWENLLSGFHSCFYFMLAFSVALLYVSTGQITAQTLPVLALLGLCNLFTMASGLLAPAVAALLIAIRVWRRELSIQIGLSAILILVALVVFAFSILPHVAYHDSLKAHGITEFVQSAYRYLSWPFDNHVLGAVAWLPSVIAGARLLNPSFRTNRIDTWVIALAAWIFIQVLGMAYSRGSTVDDIPARYCDLLLVGTFSNLCLMVRLLTGNTKRAWDWTAILMKSTCILICVGAVAWKGNLALQQMQGRAKLYRVQQTNVVSYLHTNNESAIRNKPFLESPFPNDDYLIDQLNSSTVRAIMPLGINRGDRLEQISGNFIPLQSPSPLGDKALASPRGTNGYFRSSPFNVKQNRIWIPVKFEGPTDGIRISLSATGARSKPLSISQGSAGKWILLSTERPDTGPIQLSAESSQLNELSLGRPQGIGTLGESSRWLLNRAGVLSVLAALLFLAWLIYCVYTTSWPRPRFHTE